MNILVINGSPKGEHSNTLRLTNAFLDGICDAEKGSLPQIERLNVAQMDIAPCLGCFSCWKNTPGKLKTVIDRQLPLVLPFMLSDAESGGHSSRYDMSGKKQF